MPKRTMKEIKRIGADLKPTIHVGKDGITDSLIEEVKLQVKTRKVVKIRLLPASGEETEDIAKEISERSGAVLVDARGSIVLLTQQDFLERQGLHRHLGRIQMLDVSVIRENPERIREMLKNRNYPEELINKFLTIDNEWRKLVDESNQLKRKRNEASHQIPKLKGEEKNKAGRRR